jgi:protein ImuA
MRYVHACDAKLVFSALPASRAGGFVSGIEAWDGVAPGGRFARGAVHELLWAVDHPVPRTAAALLARAALQVGAALQAGGTSQAGACGRALVWFDPDRSLNPVALFRLGIEPARLLIVRPPTPGDVLPMLAECVRCQAVGAVVAGVGRLDRVQARKLQLCAEAGGGVALLLRRRDQAGEHAAVSRWLVAPHPGTRLTQRWRIELVQGHGGLVHQPLILEHRRDTDTFDAHRLREAARLADRPDQAKAG